MGGGGGGEYLDAWVIGWTSRISLLMWEMMHLVDRLLAYFDLWCLRDGCMHFGLGTVGWMKEWLERRTGLEFAYMHERES